MTHLVALGVIICLLYSTNYLFFRNEAPATASAAPTRDAATPGLALVNRQLLTQLRDGGQFAPPSDTFPDLPVEDRTVQADPRLLEVARSIAAEIGSHWRISDALYDNHYAIVALSLRDNGQVKGLQSLFSSGNTFFNASLRRAIRRGEPYTVFRDLDAEEREQLADLVLHFGGGSPPSAEQLAQIRRELD